MKLYAIYTGNEDLVFTGDRWECSEFLKCSEESFRCRYSRFTRGVTKNPKYKIYRIDED